MSDTKTSNTYANWLKLSCSAIAVACLGVAGASAQDASEAEGEEDSKRLDQVIVVGTVETSILEASNPVTRISEETLELQAPRSVADALINVPSLQIDPSFGSTNNQFRFRGIGAGGTQFLELEEDGIPIQRDGPDFYYRVSNAIERIDVVRGGVSPIYRTAAVGAIIDFQYREGSLDEYEGDLYFQGSDFGQRRVEAFYGGPISENTSFALAGWYSEDEGIREVDFDANEGFNLYASIKHEFSDGNGHMKFSARTLQENNLVYFAGNPLLGNTDDPRPFPGGPDISDETMLSQEFLLFSTFSAPGVQTTLDNTNGEETDVTYFGAEFERDLDMGIRLVGRTRYTESNSKFAGQYGGGFAAGGADFQTGDQLVSNLITAGFPSAGGIGIYQQAFAPGFNGTSYQITNLSGEVLDGGTLAIVDANGNGILEPGEVASASTATALANGNGIFTPFGIFTQSNPFDSFQIDLEASKSFATQNPFGDGDADHRIAVGYYYVDQNLNQDGINTLLVTDLQPQARRINVLVTDDATGDTVSLTDDGILAHNIFPGGFRINDQINAFYAVYEGDFGNLKFDVGVRQDSFESERAFAQSQSAFGDGLRQMPVPTPGTISPAQLGIQQITGFVSPGDGLEADEDFTSWSVGGSYLFTDDLSVYGRYTKAGIPLGRLSDLQQIEAGVRYQNDRLALATNFFILEQESDQLSGQIFDEGTGQLVNTIFERDNEVIGVEFEGELEIIEDLLLFANFTYQEPTIATDARLLTLESGQLITNANFDGNRNPEQPEILGTFDLRYSWDFFGLGEATANANVRHVGDRFVNFENTRSLDAYTTLNLGFQVEAESGWYGRVNVQNATDETALQGAFNGTGGFGTLSNNLTEGFYGRPILGRNIIFGIGYKY